MTPILVIALLIAVNALYVAAEFAAVSVRTSRLQQKAAEGDRLASRLLPFLRDVHALDSYIAACQIGITVSSLVLGAYGQAALAGRLAPVFASLGGLGPVAAQSTAVAVVLVGLTALQMILGELVPKSLAMQFPTAIARATTIPMVWSHRLMAWFIAVLNGSGTLVLRVLGFRPGSHRHVHSPEELALLVAESRAGGMFTEAEHERLERALRLGQIRVTDIMVPRTRIQAVEAGTPLGAVIPTLTQSPYTRLPVYRGTLDDVIGLLHTKDVARMAATGVATGTAGSLVQPVVFAPPGLTAERLLVMLREQRRQFAIVLDEFGGTAGLVTIEDILEIVVGDIADEFKGPEREPERQPDGRVRLPGETRVDQLETWIGTNWADDVAHTVGGRVVAAFGRVPAAGERIDIHGADVEVEAVHGAAVTAVLVRPAVRRPQPQRGPA